jgi:O-antigen ligase
MIGFAPLIEGGTTHFPMFLMRISLFLFCLAWVIRQEKDGVIHLCWNKLSPWVVGLFMLGLVSVIWAPYKDIAIQWGVTLAMYVAVFQVACHGVRSLHDVRMLVILMLGMGTFQAALGMIQYFGLGSYRAHGTFFNPNFFATYQVGITALVVSLLCYSGTNHLTKREKFVLCLIGVLSLSAFVLARSRGALFALMCVMTFIGILRFGKMALPCLLACVLLVIIVPNPIRERGIEVTAHDPFAYTRIDIWKNAIDRIAGHPWGSGLGMYKYVSFLSRFPVEGEIVRFGKRAETAHNEYLQITVELGIGGLLIFLAGTIVWMKKAWRIFLGGETSVQRGTVLGLIGIVLAMLIHAVIDSVFHEPALVVLLIVAGSMVLAVGRIRSEPDQMPSEIPIHCSRGRKVVMGIVLSILLVLTVQPAIAWFAFERGNEQMGAHRVDHALGWYRAATMVQPWNAAYHNALASSDVALFHASGERGLILDAVDEMKLCMALNPLDGRYPYRLGTLYELLGKQAHNQDQIEWLRHATASYQMAVTKDPYAPVNYVALGKLLLRQGSLQEARASFAKAVEYEPNYLPARALAIEVALQLGDADAANHDYLELLEIMKRFKGRTMSVVERQFLDVDLDRLKRRFQS